MKNLLKIVSIIGLTVITQTAYSAAVTDTFTTGDTLTAEKLNNIKDAVNDNDMRINDIVLTPGPAGADSTVAGPTGPAGADSTVAGPTGPAGADSTVAGPTGPAGADSTVAGPTGPAGADSTVAGPTGPAGADSTVAGPTGPAGADSTVAGPTGPAGADSTVAGPTGPAGGDGPDGTSCTVIRGEGSATISCGVGTMASVYDGTTATGNAVGDMQYWDGSEWVLVPPPADTTVVSTLRFVNDKPTWRYSPSYYQPGDRGPAGGFVFYVTDGGLHGLEAAPMDQSDAAEWGCYEDNVTGAVGTDIGTGAQNTDAIVSFGCDDGSPAALAATGYELNGYSDWFLPSKDELNELYQNHAVVGGFVIDIYWSSSYQVDSSYPWAQYFDVEGILLYDSKNTPFRVRAVRAF
jgi:hypothetical protein